jgi:SAM-dependent methyltransferase
VDRYFDSAANYWKAIYEKRTVNGLIHQERKAIALEWIDGLALPADAAVLEIGCGAGLTSAALADRGFTVTATDHAPAMIELTNQLVHDRNLAGRIRTSVIDVHSLPFQAGSFSLVLALGVLPWLHSPELALEEIARVLQPGGLMLVNVDNVFRLHFLLDPRLNPALGLIRRFVGTTLRRLRIMRTSPVVPPNHLDSPRHFDADVAGAGLDKVKGATFGFGPFTFLNRPILSDRDGIRLHRKLQDLADRGVPVVRSVGAQYLLLARKPESS